MLNRFSLTIPSLFQILGKFNIVILLRVANWCGGKNSWSALRRTLSTYFCYLGPEITLASLVPISGPKKSRYSVGNDGKMRIFRASDGPRQLAFWITDQSTRWSPNRWTQRPLNSWPLRRRRRSRAGPRLCPPSPRFSRLLWPRLRCGSVGYAATGPPQSRSSRPTSPPPTSGTGSSDGSDRRTAACCAATWLPPPSASRIKLKVRNLRFQV